MGKARRFWKLGDTCGAVEDMFFCLQELILFERAAES